MAEPLIVCSGWTDPSGRTEGTAPGFVTERITRLARMPSHQDDLSVRHLKSRSESAAPSPITRELVLDGHASLLDSDAEGVICGA